VSNPGSVPHPHTTVEDAVDLETWTRQELGRLYLEDSRPWVVAFSGGKDSTLVLQLVYELLVELGEKAHKPVFVVTTDTGVEAPNVSAYVSGVLGVIRDHARAARLPLLDLSTPSCGGSRFGCWTCTVVKEDKSLQGFIQSGEDWMEPLNAFRNRLKEVRERDDWRATIRRDGSSGPGPFLPERRRQLLRELLDLERKVGQRLIDDQEIHYIQQAWRMEFDLKGEALEIASHYGRTIGPMEDLQLPDAEQQILEQLVAERGISPDLVERLLRLVLQDYPDLRVWGSKAALQRDIEEAISVSLAQEETTRVEP